MERLTWEDYHGGCYAQDILQQDYDTATVFTGEPIDRLAAYERTNHTPEECAVAFTELAAYRAAEQDGTLLRLPCKVGDTVYRVIPWCTYGFANCVGCPRATKSRCEIAFFEQEFSVSLCDQIGKTVFLTREAAEAALKEQEGQK